VRGLWSVWLWIPARAECDCQRCCCVGSQEMSMTPGCTSATSSTCSRQWVAGVTNRATDALHRYCAARWLSFVFALITCLNKATLVANTVAADPFIQARIHTQNRYIVYEFTAGKGGVPFPWRVVGSNPSMLHAELVPGACPQWPHATW